MAHEIERKFLVKADLLPPLTHGQSLKQGYICTDPERVVRVRVAEGAAFITVKGKTVGATRLEFEYAIAVDDAEQMLRHLAVGPIIEKVRHRIAHQDHIWDLDIFSGDNEGLIVAEVELSEEGERVALPAWVDREVTGEDRYYNSNLRDYPFKQWQSE